MKREYPDHPVAAVAAVVFDDQDRLLLVRRGKEPGKGLWGIPGGGVELGEQLDEAIKRELREETGLKVKPIDIITVVDRVYRDDDGLIRFHYIIVEFLCRAGNGVPRASDDVDRALWVSLEEARTYPLPSITQEVIEKAWDLFMRQSARPAR
jgi:ADP-ribose pyrophosphatase YjhB (NUDIX family)